jgi:cytochrome c oxidase subunit 5b
VVVESAFHQRIVGVTDPDDDCLVVWDIIKENEPPKQLIPGGDYFVLKHVPPKPWMMIPSSTLLFPQRC